MPELPEVETMRRGVLAVQGQTIRSVARARCRLKPIQIEPSMRNLSRRVRGQRIQRVDRAGKRVVFWLESTDAMVMEPRMTGLVLLADPPNTAHLRFIVELTGKGPKRVLYWDRRGLGRIYLLSKDEFAERSLRLGPDAMQVTDVLLKRQFSQSKRPIKVALLDQQLLAGIGNLYASEILHLARVNPKSTCDSVSGPQWKRISSATLEVLHAAIRCEGSTLSDGTYRNALNNPGGYQNHHRVYDRAGDDCPTCRKATIRRIVQAQRSTFYCPQCQPQ